MRLRWGASPWTTSVETQAIGDVNDRPAAEFVAIR
jgi:hypothetical protein